MQVKTISYKRVNSLGNYSSEHLEAYAELLDGEDPITRAKMLKAIVEEALGIKPPAKQPTKEPQPSNGDDDEEFKF